VKTYDANIVGERNMTETDDFALWLVLDFAVSLVGFETSFYVLADCLGEYNKSSLEFSPFFLVNHSPKLDAYHEWFDHVMNLESVKRTLPDNRYLEHITKDADGSARGKVANAVRRGVAAHEFDDEKDEY
jgi:hypothetical protein